MAEVFEIYRTVKGLRESRRLKDLFDVIASKMIYQHDRWARILIWFDVELCDVDMKPIESAGSDECRLVYSSYKEDSRLDLVDELIPNIRYAQYQLSVKEYLTKRMSSSTSDGPGTPINQLRQCYKITVNYTEYFDTPFDVNYGDLAEEKKWMAFEEGFALLKTCIEESLLYFKNLVAWIDD